MKHFERRFCSHAETRQVRCLIVEVMEVWCDVAGRVDNREKHRDTVS